MVPEDRIQFLRCIEENVSIDSYLRRAVLFQHLLSLSVGCLELTEDLNRPPGNIIGYPKLETMKWEASETVRECKRLAADLNVNGDGQNEDEESSMVLRESAATVEKMAKGIWRRVEDILRVCRKRKRDGETQTRVFIQWLSESDSEECSEEGPSRNSLEEDGDGRGGHAEFCAEG